MILDLGLHPKNYAQLGAAANDADAQAFIDAAGITDATQKTAVNQLVLDLKGYSIWTKMKAIYPIIGGSASSHAVNLKTPGTFNLTFSTGWTHASTGMTPTNAYANTNLIPTTSLTQNNTHISFYSRTDSNGLYFDIGTGKATNEYLDLITRNAGNLLADQYNNTTGRITVANPNSLGYYISTRTASNVFKVFKNGSQLGTTNTGASTGFTQLTVNTYISALLQNTSVLYYSNRQCAFASIGDGLTDAESSNFNTAVTTYQTTLSRNV